jgi:hypothetical protein
VWQVNGNSSIPPASKSILAGAFEKSRKKWRYMDLTEAQIPSLELGTYFAYQFTMDHTRISGIVGFFIFSSPVLLPESISSKQPVYR